MYIVQRTHLKITSYFRKMTIKRYLTKIQKTLARQGIKSSFVEIKAENLKQSLSIPVLSSKQVAFFVFATQETTKLVIQKVNKTRQPC